ncbi:DUF4352 domain-containing protein [Corynebacterium rouxii]|uniref:DUF4352 domain-containing protein n=1 Tax=Corynebacterium rouxii TaxID=2719119 RepID=A0ABU3PKU8_9CORY|nr:hypothetical protein [Corynebacterium rouxii]MDT9407893.1 hypothetical protein [Corynebacterium rouxii]MDT9410075.1 hypothetical protein [Corynebacterium rouxii]
MASAKQNKPFYKRWWFLTPVIVFASIFAFLIMIALFIPEPTDLDADPASPKTDSITFHKIGETVEAPGITLTVKEVKRSAEIDLYAEGWKRGSRPNETSTAEQGEYISVVTTVKNTGKSSIDLTCGFGVQALLFNTDDQAYDPIDDLERIIDNPECNASLNPGFDTQMTWIYLVPNNTKLDSFGFADPTTHYDDLTFVSIKDAA